VLFEIEIQDGIIDSRVFCSKKRFKFSHFIENPVIKRFVSVRWVIQIIFIDINEIQFFRLVQDSIETFDTTIVFIDAFFDIAVKMG